jgi:hypothetical protein
MRPLLWRITNDVLGDDIAQSSTVRATVAAGNAGTTGAPGLASSHNVPAIDGGGGHLRVSGVRAWKLLVLALALWPARVWLCGNVRDGSVPEQATVPATRLRLVVDEQLAGDCLARASHVESQLTGHSEKCPQALRKHSRRPSPSDDDGTRPDPSNDDVTSDNLVGSDGTEGATALWSPPMLCSLDRSEDTPSPFPLPGANSWFLVLQHLRC